MLGPVRRRLVALLLVTLPAALVLALPQITLGAFPESPSVDHYCEGDTDFGSEVDCYQWVHYAKTSRALLEVADDVDLRARTWERRARGARTASAWLEAVRQRAVALITIRNAADSLQGLSKEAASRRWDRPKAKASVLNGLGAHRALAKRLAQRAKWQLAKDLQQVRQPRRPLPATAPQTPRVKRDRKRSRAADSAAKKVIGTLPSTYPAGGEPSELWTTYSRRLPTITGAMRRAQKPLGRRIRPSERRSRLVFLEELVVVYRDDALQIKRRAEEAEAAGRPCSAELLEHANNALKRAATTRTLIAAVKRGERGRTAKKRALKRFSTLAGTGRQIAKRVRNCLADQPSIPTPAPTPPETPLGNVSSALCPTGLKIGDVAVKLVEHRLVNPFRTDPNTSGTFTCRYESPPEAGLEVPAEAGVDLTYLREHSDRRRFCGIPAGVPGFLNSATHEIQVFVPPWVDGADGVRASLLATLEAAPIGVPC